MVAKEFTRRRIAPLQVHTSPMWLYAGENDPMRLSHKNHEKEVVDEIMKTLYSTITVPNPSDEALPMYRLSTREEIVAAMPCLQRDRKGSARTPSRQLPTRAAT